MKKALLFLFVVSFGIQLIAEVPVGYYDPIDTKSERELKTAIHKVIRNSWSLNFALSAQYWGDTYFKRTDMHPDGYYWDMYSNEKLTEYSSSLMAREHCLPRSWWRDQAGDDYGDANSDILNLYPSEDKANGQKSDKPLGQVGIADWTNGVSALGMNTFGDFVGKVFEPADEYKGDFARTYFYMVTCYEDYSARWTGGGLNMLENNTYPVFRQWALDLLLEWHRNDPISTKEKNRNDSAFVMQYNRNPFIDYPELVEHIWGDKKAQSFTVTNKAVSPTLILPIASSKFIIASRAKSYKSIQIRGAVLSQPIVAQLEGGDADMFKLSKTDITSDEANSGYMLTITYDPTVAGSHTTTLRLSSSEFEARDIVLSASNGGIEGVDPVEPTEDMEVMIFYKGPWTKFDLPFNFETNSGGTYANGDLKFANSGENLVVKFDDDADILQFAMKPVNTWGTTSTNHLYVYESTDAASWGTPIADFSASNTTMGTSSNYFNSHQIQLASSSRAIKIEYLKNKQNVGINNLILTKREDVGIDGIYGEKVQVYTFGGTLHIQNIQGGTVVQVFDITGRNLYKGLSNSVEISVPLRTKGIHIVKVGSKVYKVMN